LTSVWTGRKKNIEENKFCTDIDNNKLWSIYLFVESGKKIQCDPCRSKDGKTHACKQNPTSAWANGFLEQRQSGRNYWQLLSK